MPRSKEILFLLLLLVGAMGFVLWYVIDRRAKNRAAPPTAARTLAPEPPAAPVDLTRHERQTIDFSSGQPVVKDTPEDRAALDAALKDIADATKDVKFTPAPKPAPKPAEAPKQP